MDGGDIAVNTNEKMLTVWRRDGTIYSAEPGLEPEKLIGRGEQPSIVAASNGYFITWVDRRAGDLLMLTPTSTNPITIATKASDPVLAAPDSGNGPVVAVWESNDGSDSSIRLMVVTENRLSK